MKFITNNQDRVLYVPVRTKEGVVRLTLLPGVNNLDKGAYDALKQDEKDGGPTKLYLDEDWLSWSQSIAKKDEARAKEERAKVAEEKPVVTLEDAAPQVEAGQEVARESTLSTIFTDSE